jgi:hypothetical protein
LLSIPGDDGSTIHIVLLMDWEVTRWRVLQS